MEREDLGALFARITRRIVDAERPLLERHGLTRWEYVALSELAGGSAPTQLALAEAIGYDKTRLIALLDGLAEAGLVQREPADDRRARTVALTAAGRKRLEAVRRDVRAMEDDLMGELTAAERGTLVAVLRRLAR